MFVCLFFPFFNYHLSQLFLSYSGIGNDSKKLYGVQFHPEVDLTENGKVMMKNFLMDICGFHGNYTMQGREQACIDYIRNTVGSHKVLVSRMISDLFVRHRHWHDDICSVCSSVMLMRIKCALHFM